MNTETRKYEELKILLKEKNYEMKSKLRVNFQLLNNNIEEREFRNINDFSNFFIVINGK